MSGEEDKVQLSADDLVKLALQQNAAIEEMKKMLSVFGANSAIAKASSRDEFVDKVVCALLSNPNVLDKQINDPALSERVFKLADLLWQVREFNAGRAGQPSVTNPVSHNPNGMFPQQHVQGGNAMVPQPGGGNALFPQGTTGGPVPYMPQAAGQAQQPYGAVVLATDMKGATSKTPGYPQAQPAVGGVQGPPVVLATGMQGATMAPGGGGGAPGVGRIE